MTSGEPHRSEGQFLQPQRALSSPLASSSVPSQEALLGYSFPSSVVESLQTGSATHRAISPTILRSTLEFGPVTGQSDPTGQPQLSRNSPYSGEIGSSSFSSDPGPSSLHSTFPVQGRGDLPSSAFSESEGQLRTVEDQRVRDYNMSSYPIAMGQEAYLSGQMPPNISMPSIPSSTAPTDLVDIWPNRSPRPLQSIAAMDQQSQLYSSPGYMAYSAQGNPGQPYYHGRPSAQYLSSQQAQPHLRSPSMSYTYPSNSITGSPPLPDQSMIPASPNYILNQGDYYLPDTSSIPSNPCSLPVSPQTQPTTIYSSPESASAPPTTITSTSDDHQVRVISPRPRPQCWDHGCNGREFSTFSNLLRHQREKSGAVAKAECPTCGAVFTRSTARNIHVSQGKCKSGSAPAGPGGGP